MAYTRKWRAGGVLTLTVAQLALGCLGSSDVAGQAAADTERTYPRLTWGRELTLSAAGTGLLGTSLLVGLDRVDVPPHGLDGGAVRWNRDRAILGNASLDAAMASDWTLKAALAMPLAFAAATAPRGKRWADLGRRSLIFAEAQLITQGITRLGKRLFGRPRPFTYLATDVRPLDGRYEVAEDRAFYSLPSGHSSSAWAAATLAMTEHLLVRPEASWLERAGIGFLGGALAGATAALRVEAGQHFPSDVLVGAGVGIGTGVTLPLLHRGERPLPRLRPWLEMLGGALTGTVLGVVAAREF